VCVKAWTAEISSNMDSKRLICHLGRRVVHVQPWNGLRLHTSTDLGRDTTFGGSFGQEGSQWRHNRLGQKLPEELAVRSTEDGWLLEGVPKKEREYRFIGGHKKVALIPC
jgi:hypothetical protein